MQAAQHDATVAAALLETLQQGRGDACTPPVEQTWVAVYTSLAGTLQAAAQAVNEFAHLYYALF